uniref:Interleukin-13 n=1 Tax=Prolemur simus TaxID=1328070 RepID=A0A8C9AQ22_PROSS
MWPLWTILLLMQLWGSLGAPLCQREPFYFLVAIMKMLGNKNDGTLYTPDDLSVSWSCLIGFEEGPSVGTAVFRLQRLLDALGSRLWVASQGPCLPCEVHPQRSVPLFLAKLLELLQGACARHLPTA